MTKAFSTLTAVALAASIVSAASLTPANAGSKGKYIAGGIILGVLATTAVVKAKKKRNRQVSSSSWDQHVLACHRAYKSYEESSDTYVSNSGRVRRCTK